MQQSHWYVLKGYGRSYKGWKVLQSSAYAGGSNLKTFYATSKKS